MEPQTLFLRNLPDTVKIINHTRICHTGKHQFKQRTGRLGRFSVLASRGAHSSVKSACDLMDIDVSVVEGDSSERLMRFCFVNPKTTVEDVRVVLETMK